MTAVPAYSAEETEASFVYLRGDVDLNGTVNIEDATALQRAIAEAETLSGLQTVMANVTGDGYDINTVTQLQKFTAEAPCEAPVGEVIEEGDDGIIYSMPRDVIINFGAAETKISMPFAFSTKYPDVIFADGEIFGSVYYYLTLTPFDEMDEQADETSYRLTMLGRGTMTWDYARQCIEFDNFDAYVCGKGKEPFAEMVNSRRSGDNVFCEHTEDEYFVNGNPLHLDCAFDKVPLIRDQRNKLFDRDYIVNLLDANF